MNAIRCKYCGKTVYWIKSDLYEDPEGIQQHICIKHTKFD